MSLSFNYSLDNEIKAPAGQLPSGIQTQAFEMILNRLAERLNILLKLLGTPVPNTGAAPLFGMSKGWQQRIRAEAAFLQSAWPQLLRVAQTVAFNGAGNAVDQEGLAPGWNRWSGQALQAYKEAISAFQADVDKAMSNRPANGLPAAFVKLSLIARMAPPVLTRMKTVAGGLSGFGIADPSSTFCVSRGGRVEVVNNPAGQSGVCRFPDGSSCETWAFYRGECGPKPAASFWTKWGGKIPLVLLVGAGLAALAFRETDRRGWTAPLGLGMNDTEREQWVDNDEGLYDMQRRSRLSKREWVRQNRALIDDAAGNIRSGRKQSHYLKYDRTPW
jgi:hypothetical protein